MTEKTPAAKLTTRELVATVLSVLIILSGIAYWLSEALAMVDLVQMAYEFSLLQIIGRFLLVALVTGLIATIVIFIQRRVNKGL